MSNVRKEDPAEDETFMVNEAINRSTVQKSRLILMRNGEPCDRLTDAWRYKALAKGYNLVDINQPFRVVNRSEPTDSFKNDSPLTSIGSVCSQLIGRAVGNRFPPVNVVFCSPALRCVQSAASFMCSLDQKHPPRLCVEPGLFEPLLFYWQDRMPDFLSADQLIESEYPVDKEYRKCYSIEQLTADLFKEKTISDVYERYAKVAAHIEKESRKQKTTVVISHAPTLDGIVRSLQGRTDLPKSNFDLHRMGLSYPFCGTVVVENSSTGKWILNGETLPPLTILHSSNRCNIPDFE